jgi:hypothetical protein
MAMATPAMATPPDPGHVPCKEEPAENSMHKEVRERSDRLGHASEQRFQQFSAKSRGTEMVETGQEASARPEDSLGADSTQDPAQSDGVEEEEAEEGEEARTQDREAVQQVQGRGSGCLDQTAAAAVGVQVQDTGRVPLPQGLHTSVALALALSESMPPNIQTTVSLKRTIVPLDPASSAGPLYHPRQVLVPLCVFTKLWI